MGDLEIAIINHEKNQDAHFDLLVIEKIDHIDRVKACSLVTIGLEGCNLIIKFEWKEDSGIEEADFLYISETSTLFFRSENQWGAIDIKKKILKRHENSRWFPLIEKRDEYVLIEDDLRAESTRLNGDKIHSVSIDPPTEAKEFEDRIEYNSPVFGKQVLKVK